MRIAICDDNTFDRDTLYQHITQYTHKNYYDAEIDIYKSGEDLLKSLKKGKFDIVFLDIYMGSGLTGIETAKKIRRIDDLCILILSTVSTDHALEGYSVKALYYIVKPITYKKVETALNLCKSAFDKNSSYLDIISNKQAVRVLHKDIHYIEVYGKVSIIHTAKDEIKTYMPLDELEQKLGGTPFYRSHRSYIVNLDHVIDINVNDFVLKSEKRVPIRKTGVKEAKTALIKYVTGR